METQTKYATYDKDGKNYTAVYGSHTGGYHVIQRPVCDEDGYDFLPAPTLKKAIEMCDAWQKWVDGVATFDEGVARLPNNDPWAGHSRHI